MPKINLSKKKIEEIETFLQQRFSELDTQRRKLDDDIQEEIDLFNNIDQFVDKKESWQSQVKVPYTYTIVQTMVARLIQALFGDDNYVRVFVENTRYADMEEKLTKWVQEVLDIMKLRSRSRDFIESALVQRTVWLQARPVTNDSGKFTGTDFDVIKWFDIWFDTTARKIEETDIFVKKTPKLVHIMRNQDHYMPGTIESIKASIPPDYIKERQEYEAQNGQPVYYDPHKNNVLDKVELLEWYGEYDFGTDKKPDLKHVIFTIANRKSLVRAETTEMKTRRKHMFFPIRPLRQGNSLVGKGVPQLIKTQQYELNETRSLRMQNFKTQINLLYKFRRHAGIDFDELFVGAGNAIGYDEDPEDIDTFDVPNLVQIASFMSADIVQDMQQTTGAVDYVMGTSAARGVTETASGIRQITDQALFKFSMMAQNMYDDLIEFINFIIILHTKYGKSDILVRHPELKDFFSQREEELENSYAIDIALQDLAMRRDVERAQFVNAINIIGQLLMQTGGNVKELLKQVMKVFKVPNIEKILEPPPQVQDQTGAVMEAEAKANQQRGGSMQAVPGMPTGARPEEIAAEENTARIAG